MNPEFPLTPNLIFFGTIAFIFFAVIIGVKSSLKAAHSINQSGATQTVAFLLTAVLIALAFLAKQGFFFKGIDRMPPRLMLVFVVMFALIIALLFIKRVGEILDYVPPSWLIYPQVFRVAIEIVLWQLYGHGFTPEQMTFEGLNFDILAGATAPIAAFVCFGQGRNLRVLAIIWNILGLALLINIITIAIMSVPAVGYFDQPNTFVAWFPYIWLPGIAVPFAMLLHALSLRQLIRAGRKA